jgi:Tol biopolymer transport system component
MKNALSAAAVLLGALSITACGSGNGDNAADPAPSTAAPTTVATTPPDTSPGTLLMSSFDESTHTFLNTFTIQPDGSDRHQIPMPDEGGGRWSHAGDEIAVSAVLDDGRIGTAILNRDGKVERVLAVEDATLNLPCTVWSPDDKRLACEGWDEGDEKRTGIYTVRSSDGGGLSRITAPKNGLADLPGDFSPDGSRLLFKRAHGEDVGPLLEVSVDGGSPTPVGDSLVEDPARYSPDGRRILTASQGHLLVLAADGVVVSDIAEDGCYLFGAVWSPDGKRIAFSRSTQAFRADVFTSLPDGTDRRQVTATEANEIRVEWGPS